MRRKLTMLVVCLFATLAVHTKEQPDSALYSRYARLFNVASPDSADAFYALSAQLQQFYKEHGQTEEYYNARRVEVRYEADRGQYLDAIKRANTILSDMKKNNSDMRFCDIVYCSLGTVYYRQGNTRMAIHYFNEALRHITPKDSLRFIHAYAGLAHAYIIQDPDKALKLNERVGQMLTKDSIYYKVYLAHQVQIYFYKHDKPNFLKAAQEYERLVNSPSAPKYRYGEKMIDVMENAMTDRHNEVLRGLDEFSNDVGRMDARIHIFESMGREDLALQEAYRRMEAQDSFNHELLHESLEELDTAQAINELMAKAAKEREFWMTVVIILLIIGVALLISRYLIRRRLQKQLMQKNEELEIALDDAKEVERMKTAFIQHVSHEMRTPMNIINGYSQIIADPSFELDEENRAELIQAINQNTMAMTTTINDLLDISNDSSKERYARDQHIVLGDFCRNIMKQAENKNMGRLELKFTTMLPDDFEFYSNAEGLERILKQLMKNARQNTEKGSIWLDVRQTDDGCRLEFTVTDTGCGIPEEHHDRIFDHFYKVDSFKPGLGVGLSVALKIAIRLGGSITLVKGYKGGARFVLAIPTGL